LSTITSVNPAAPDEVIAEVTAAGSADVDAAVEAAQRAQRAWHAGGAVARAAALDALADRVRSRSDELATLIAREVGKPIVEARGEVARAVAILRYHAQGALDPHGAHIPAGPGAWALWTQRRPRGVAGLITPWNFPLAIPFWKAAPALAAGNAAVLKAAPPAAACAAAIAELAADALPAGVFQVLQGDAEAGEALVSHPGVDCVSFTGSTAVGRKIIAATAARGVPAQVETGGQNPSIVLADADLAHAAATIANAAMGYAGQKCTATSRIIVEAPVMDAFLAELDRAIAAMAVGDPLDDATAVGPVISEVSLRRASGAVQDAVNRGGSLLRGGDRPGPGWTIAPTLVRVASPDDELAQDEVFAPVAAVVEAASASEATEIANGVRYGLAAAVFTRSLGAAARAIDQLEAGLVRVNQSTAGVDLHAPFGGMKDSSFGPREQGATAREFYTETQTVTVGLAPEAA
jgi:aldehyde dehydrogenase (NAD+)